MREHLIFYQVKTKDLGIDRFSKQIIKRAYLIPSDLLTYGGIPFVYALVLFGEHKRFKKRKIDVFVSSDKKEELYDTIELAFILRGVIKGVRQMWDRKGVWQLKSSFIDRYLRDVKSQGRGMIKNEKDMEEQFKKCWGNVRVHWTAKKDLKINIGGKYEFERRKSQSRLSPLPKPKFHSSIYRV